MTAQRESFVQTSSTTLEVILEWRGTVMAVAHLNEGGHYAIGDGGDFEFVHPALPAGSRFTVAEVRDGRVRVAIPPTVNGWTRFGEEVAAIEPSDQFQVIELEGDARARIELDDLVVHCGRVQPATALPKVRGALIDGDTKRSMGAAIALHAAVLIMAWSLPLDAATLSADGFDANNRFVEFVLTPERAPVDPFEAVKKTGDGDNGAAEAAPSPEPPEANAGGAPAPKVDKKVEAQTREMARTEAKKVAEDAVAALNGQLDDVFNDRGPLSDRAAVAMNGLFGDNNGTGTGLGGFDPDAPGRGWGDGPGAPKSQGIAGTFGKCKDCGEAGGRYDRGVSITGTRVPKEPVVVPLKPEIIGGLSRDIIQRVIRQNRAQYLFCYEKELKAHRDMAGKLVVKFTIGPSGQVIAARSEDDTVGGDVAECVIRKVRRWQFPVPVGGGIVNVRYPFLFKSSRG